MSEEWEFAGTSRMNASGASGTGTATIPKSVSMDYLDENGKADMVVFQRGRRIMLVPREDLRLPDQESDKILANDDS